MKLIQSHCPTPSLPIFLRPFYIGSYFWVSADRFWNEPAAVVCMEITVYRHETCKNRGKSAFVIIFLFFSFVFISFICCYLNILIFQMQAGNYSQSISNADSLTGRSLPCSAPIEEYRCSGVWMS